MRKLAGVLSVLAVSAACSDTQSVVGGPLPRDAGAAAMDAPDVVAAPDVATAPDVVDVVAAPDVVDVVAAPDVVDAGGCASDGDCPGMACDVASARCVPCTAARQDLCPASQHCQDNRCVDGCRADEGCAATPDTPRCDVTRSACVRCVEDAHCPDGQLCRANACVPGCSATRPCPNSGACCDGACFDPLTSADHCGACGRRCMTAGGSPACQSGACVVGMCDTGRGDCDMDAANGCEADVATNAAHCGMCGNACPARAHALSTCAEGRCGYACEDGFADCDMDPANGCEVELATSAAHCGMCGNACAAGANATASCAAGRCATSCNAGFADCDMSAANGCEVNLRTSPAHCGACGAACGTGEQCVFGVGMSMGDACRPSCFIGVERVAVPGSAVIVGFDPAWGAPRTVTGTMGRGAVLVDAVTPRVTGAVFSVTSVGDVRAEATRLEAAVVGALGAGTTPVLVGRAFTSHEGFPGVSSTYRVARSTTAAALRDALIMPLAGVAAAATPATPAASTFVVDVTTVRRTGGAAMNRTDLIVTITSQADLENNALPTALHAADLSNATSVAAEVESLGFQCQQSRATVAAPVVDFVWTVDTSGSMGTYQTQIGNAASQFFTRMRQAGLDFRVSVLQAGYTSFNLDSPGYTWISGSAMDGGLELCRRVTYSTCPLPGTDSLRPYTMGGSEQPTAAAVIAHDALRRRAQAGEVNMDRRLRPNARFVAVLVTDEPGSNDFNSYFRSTNAPDTAMPWGATYNTTALGNIVGYFQRNRILTFGIVPVSTTPCSSAAVADLPRCAIEGNGGAAIPIGRATTTDVAAALTRIVDGIGGATSEFVLPRTPITSMIRVRVRGMEAPRSRVDGFDYDPASRSVVFYGTTWRPRPGDEVVISYRTWG